MPGRDPGACGGRFGRRTFVRSSVAWLIGAGMSPALARALAGEERSGAAVVRWHKKLEGSKVQCLVCPLECVLADGEVCFCRTRMNRSGTCYNMAYNNPSVVGVDPIEKGPFAHYLPGTKAFALGTSGCNLRCQYCQNFELSQKMPVETENLELAPAQVVSETRAEKCRNVMFTYTEPVAFHEYALEVAKEARRAGYRVQAATAAFARPEPFVELVSALDAVSISLKGFTEEFYKKVCGQSLAPVLEAIKAARSTRVWIEIVNVVLPGYNDAPDDIRRMCRWIATEIGPDTPLHLARFFPAWRLKDLVPTPIATLESARRIALEEGLRFVYLANVGLHPATSTRCPGCQAEVMLRDGLVLRENRLVNGACPSCAVKLPGVWDQG